MKKLGLALFFCLLLSVQVAHADTITTAPAGGDSYDSFAWMYLGNISLTNSDLLTGISGIATVSDQDWGGSDPGDNAVRIGLFDNGSLLLSTWVVGASHPCDYCVNVTTGSYTFSAGDLIAYNAALAAIPDGDTISLEIFGTPLGYPGWELHVSDASETASYTATPEPASLTLLGFGLVALALKKRQTA